MLLDAGICSVFQESDISAPAKKPVKGYTLLCKSWYGELSFETVPYRATEPREDVKTDARIRILQNRSINNHDTVLLSDSNAVTSGSAKYTIERAYHGVDDESGELITDLTLKKV